MQEPEADTVEFVECTSDPSWNRDVSRDNALSNDAIAREISNLAGDGSNVYRTVLGMLNRIRPKGAQAAPKTWHSPNVHPGLGEKIIGLWSDGSGARLVWLIDTGSLDEHGDEIDLVSTAKLMTEFSAWSYLPPGFKFKFEDGDDYCHPTATSPDASAFSEITQTFSQLVVLQSAEIQRLSPAYERPKNIDDLMSKLRVLLASKAPPSSNSPTSAP